MKKVILFSSLVILIFFISSFTKEKNETEFNLLSSNEATTALTQQQVRIYSNLNIPFLGRTFNGFKEAVAFKESQGRYDIVNIYGYLGKYQFGKSTLKRLKVYDTSNFLKNPELQEDAFVALCSLNKWILKRDIKRCVGKKINGIVITESGILAAAHLGGAGNVKKYLRSNGQNVFKDAFGSSVQHYIKKFANYDTSFIKANKKPLI